MTLEVSANGGATWTTDPDYSVTVVPDGPQYIAEIVPRGLQFRFTLTGATSPNLNVFFNQGAGA